MQKFLLGCVFLMIGLGLYVMHVRRSPDICSDRAINQYVNHQLGISSLSHEPPLDQVKTYQMQYIRKNDCFDSLDQVDGRYVLPVYNGAVF